MNNKLTYFFFTLMNLISQITVHAVLYESMHVDTFDTFSLQSRLEIMKHFYTNTYVYKLVLCNEQRVIINCINMLLSKGLTC